MKAATRSTACGTRRQGQCHVLPRFLSRFSPFRNRHCIADRNLLKYSVSRFICSYSRSVTLSTVFVLEFEASSRFVRDLFVLVRICSFVRFLVVWFLV